MPSKRSFSSITAVLICALIATSFILVSAGAANAYTNDQDTSNQMVAFFSAIEQKKQAEKDRQAIESARQQIEYESGSELARLDGDYQRGVISPDAYYQTRAMILQNRQLRLASLANVVQTAQYQQAQMQQAAIQNQLYAEQIATQQRQSQRRTTYNNNVGVYDNNGNRIGSIRDRSMGNFVSVTRSDE